MKNGNSGKIDYGQIPFPRYIDKPRLIGVFEVDEFALFFGIIVVMVAGSLAFPNLGSTSVMIGSMAIGGFSAYAYKKFKRNRPEGYTVQKLYRTGIFSPTDSKQAYIKYPYLRKIGRVIPYGFTKELLN